MSGFSLSDVARLAGLPETRIGALVQAQVLEPDGNEGDWRFSFRDLVLCRSAKSLVDGHITPDRLTDALREVKARLPDATPLSGVGLSAEGRQVVARDDGVCWEVDSGQVRFDFGEPLPTIARAIVNLGSFEPEAVIESESSMMTALEWFESRARP